MQLRYEDIVTIYDKLKSVVEKKLPLSVGHILQRNFEQFEKANKDFEDARSKLLIKYGKHDKDGNLIIKSAGNQQRIELEDAMGFDTEYQELLNIEIEITIDTFSEDKLNMIDLYPDKFDQLSPKDLSALNIMIKDGDE